MNTTLGNAVSEMLKDRSFQNIKIYASDSLDIVSVFELNNILSVNCQILLREPDTLLNCDKSNRIYENVIRAKEKWKELQNKGNITRIEYKLYNFLPTNYFIIFEDKILIHGLFNIDLNSLTHTSYNFNANMITDISVVTEYVEWFHNVFNLPEQI